MSMKLIFNMLVVSVLSFVLVACNESSNDSTSSKTFDDGSHIVVYQEEIYKGWPYQ